MLNVKAMVNTKILIEKDQKEVKTLMPEDPDIEIVKEGDETNIMGDLTNIDPNALKQDSQ